MANSSFGNKRPRITFNRNGDALVVYNYSSNFYFSGETATGFPSKYDTVAIYGIMNTNIDISNDRVMIVW